MNILVCIKQVPGSNNVEVDPVTGVLKRNGIQSKLNPYDLYAIELALTLAEKHGGSGVSDEGFREAIACGIRKINYYSYMSGAGYEAAKKVIERGDTKYLHDVEYSRRNFSKYTESETNA